MKKIKEIMALSLCATTLLVGCRSNATTKEENKSETAVEQKKEVTDKKVIAGTTMSAELLDLIDVDAVGVLSTKKELPERFKDLPEIGSPMKPDLEKVVSLNPDLYISDGNLKGNIEELFKEKNINTLFLNNNSYEDVIKNIEDLGKYFEKEEKTKDLVSKMKKEEERILDSVKGKEAPKVLVIFGTTESFMLATKHSYAGSLVEKLGGKNVTDELSKDKSTPYVPFSLEAVANLNPDIILRLTHMEPEASKEAFEKEFSKGLWVNLDAVKNNKVYDLDPNYFGVSANIKAVEALEKMSEILYK
ncbi:ABC transporter substrate-binding protein [Clostridium sp. Marseille-QA1073]